jgi:small subunit ribosomal protein S9
MEQEEREPTQNGAQDPAAGDVPTPPAADESAAEPQEGEESTPAAEEGAAQPQAGEEPTPPAADETTAQPQPSDEPASEAVAPPDSAPEQAADDGQAEGPTTPAPQEPEQAPTGEPGAGEDTPTKLAELAADARYFATGKRKSAVARVILLPGSGRFELNGRSLEIYFPRGTHQAVVKQPLEVAGFVGRIDVRARIHGGGTSGQADAVRHGIAKALIEADPGLRGELKRRQLLTRDPRVKERRKAGLKKARKRPQFSKR